jgi:hypothetical protein
MQLLCHCCCTAYLRVMGWLSMTGQLLFVQTPYQHFYLPLPSAAAAALLLSAAT